MKSLVMKSQLEIQLKMLSEYFIASSFYQNLRYYSSLVRFRYFFSINFRRSLSISKRILLPVLCWFMFYSLFYYFSGYLSPSGSFKMSFICYRGSYPSSGTIPWSYVFYVSKLCLNSLVNACAC